MLDIETFVLSPYQSNCYLVGAGSTLIVIDPGGPDDGLNRAIGERSLDAVLCTHAHPDHVQGVDALLKEYGCPFYLHPDGEQMLRYTAPELTSFSPLRDRQELVIGDLSFRVMHFPGHSPDHVVFVSEDNATIFVGDLVFAGSIGRTDLPGCDPDAMARSLNTFKNLRGDYTLYCGHGPTTTLERERRTNPFLLQLG